MCSADRKFEIERLVGVNVGLVGSERYFGDVDVVSQLRDSG